VAFLVLAGCGTSSSKSTKTLSGKVSVLARASGGASDVPIAEYCPGIDAKGICDLSVDETHTSFGFKLTAKPGLRVALDWQIYCKRGTFEDEREGTAHGTGRILIWRPATVKDATYCSVKAVSATPYSPNAGRETVEILGRS
jgi:hypothetical protein